MVSNSTTGTVGFFADCGDYPSIIADISEMSSKNDRRGQKIFRFLFRLFESRRRFFGGRNAGMIKTVFLASGKTRLKEVKQTKTRAVETGKKGRGHDNTAKTSKKWCFSDKKTVFSIDKSFLVYYNKNSKGYTGRRKRPRNKSSCAGNCMKKYEYVNVRLGTLNTRRFSNGNVLPDHFRSPRNGFFYHSERKFAGELVLFALFPQL